MTDHTAPDAAHFSALMDSLGKAASACPRHRPPPAASVAAPLPYSGNDLDGFSSLMADAIGPAPRRAPAGGDPDKREGAGNTGYSASDRRHFDRLMSFGSYSASGAGLHDGRTDGTRETAVSCEYSSQDMETFDTLMPGASMHDNDHARERPKTRFDSAATPIRRIRIIDYDKRKEADKRRADHGNSAMKIRYFD